MTKTEWKPSAVHFLVFGLICTFRAARERSTREQDDSRVGLRQIIQLLVHPERRSRGCSPWGMTAPWDGSSSSTASKCSGLSRDFNETVAARAAARWARSYWDEAACELRLLIDWSSRGSRNAPLLFLPPLVSDRGFYLLEAFEWCLWAVVIFSWAFNYKFNSTNDLKC